MSVTEKTANVLVRFNGLGIIVFNKEKQRGEIAIIRDEKHQLSIKIRQPVFIDGKDLITYSDYKSLSAKDLGKENVEIEITTKGNSAISGYEIYQSNEDFSRLTDDNDENDFRWVANMNEFHSQNLSASKSTNPYPISKLFIENGLFYTHKLAKTLYFEKIEKDIAGNELSREKFGFVADIIGVKLESDEVYLRIKNDHQDQTELISQIGNLPTIIEISNMNYDEDAMISDLPEYYKYFDNQNSNCFDLQPIADISVGGGVNAKSYCHPVRGGDGIDSIEDFGG